MVIPNVLAIGFEFWALSKLRKMFFISIQKRFCSWDIKILDFHNLKFYDVMKCLSIKLGE